MKAHQIEIPTPFDKIPHDKIDLIALEFNRAFRRETSNKNGFPVNADLFLDWLEISTEWESVEEPNGASVFARLDVHNPETIQINDKHKTLFEERPDVYKNCVNHEAGHVVLRHFEHPAVNGNCPLFENTNPEKSFMLHSSSWGQYGLTGEEVQRRQAVLKTKTDEWVRQAAINMEARRALQIINDKFEPDWMFYQAEHFAKCLSIPRDRLFDVLEVEPLFSGWRSISRLAAIFEVSKGTMKTRLLKLKLIEMDKNGIPTPVISLPNKTLF